MQGFGRLLVRYSQLSYWRTLPHRPFDPARAVPGRRVASIRAHAQILYEPYRDKGNWTTDEDLRLTAYVIHRFATLAHGRLVSSTRSSTWAGPRLATGCNAPPPPAATDISGTWHTAIRDAEVRTICYLTDYLLTSHKVHGLPRRRHASIK